MATIPPGLRARTHLPSSSLGVAFTVPDGFVLDNTSDAVLATGPDGTALRFDGANLPSGSSLAAYLDSGWVNGLDTSSIKTFSINGLEAASARAEAKGWVFRIAVVRAGDNGHLSLIFDNESDTPGLQRAAEATITSFRRLTAQEAASLQPLRIRIVTVGAGDTVASMSARMRGVEPRRISLPHPERQSGQRAAAGRGQKVKIVSD